MKFVHLKAQVLGEAGEVEVSSCLRAIGEAVSGFSGALSWLRSASKLLDEMVVDMRRYHEADKRERRRIAAELRKEYEELRNALSRLQDELAKISRAFVRIGKACRVEGLIVEDASRNVMEDVHYIYKLLDELEQAYKERDTDRLFDLDYGLSHRVAHTLSNALSKLAVLVNTAAAKIERGLVRVAR